MGREDKKSKTMDSTGQLDVELAAVHYLLHNCEESIYAVYDAYQAGLLTAEEAMRLMTRRQVAQAEVTGWQ